MNDSRQVRAKINQSPIQTFGKKLLTFGLVAICVVVQLVSTKEFSLRSWNLSQQSEARQIAELNRHRRQPLG